MAPARSFPHARQRAVVGKGGSMLLTITGTIRGSLPSSMRHSGMQKP